MVVLMEKDLDFLDEIVKTSGKSKEELLDMGLREFSNFLYDLDLECKFTMTPKEKEDGR